MLFTVHLTAFLTLLGIVKIEANYNHVYMILASGIFNKEFDNEKHAEVLKAKNRKLKNHGDGEKKSFTNDYVILKKN